MGFKFYPPDLGVTICRSTEEEFFTQEFLASYMFDLQHSFVSFEGKSAAYNNFNRGSKKVQFFKSFLLHNPTVGRPTPGFCQSIPRTDDKEVEEEEEEEEEEEDEEEEEQDPASAGPWTSMPLWKLLLLAPLLELPCLQAVGSRMGARRPIGPPFCAGLKNQLCLIPK